LIIFSRKTLKKIKKSKNQKKKKEDNTEDLLPEALIEIGSNIKNLGNEFYKKSDFQKAQQKYSKVSFFLTSSSFFWVD